MNLSKLVLGAATVLTVSSCSQAKEAAGGTRPADTSRLNHLTFTVTPAPEWTALFHRRQGWFGGDGIFAITRNGKETQGAAAGSEALVWFSDSIIGEIKEDSLQPGWVMINNSMAVLQGGRPEASAVRFAWDQTPEGKPKSLFLPQTPATQKGDYYWLGDGFVNHKKGNNLYIFGYRIRDTRPGVPFGFEEVGNILLVVPQGQQPPFTGVRQMDVPFFSRASVDSAGSFGAGLLVNTAEAGATNPDGFVYVYGVRGKNKALMVARVQPEHIESFDRWTFWTGNGWSNDPARIQTVTDRASNELSVTPLGDGRYALIFQEEGLGKYVGLRLGATPYGPFGKVIRLFDVSPTLEQDKDIFPYNAKAHPVLSRPGELLISYNVNSFDFFKDIYTYPNLYRPRFITLKYELD
ncbi:MAG TPA: DUF4185 domain-containing protein [Chitinophagaceae bacterium]|jgi:hypothetical protein|nr:DUF4185 domain-containing protein [Chitinophagaceae bacterium]